MKLLRNIIFTLLMALVPFSVIAYLGAHVVAPEAVEVANESTLEGRSYEKFPKVKAETLASGKFQKRFESYVADHVPLRDAAVLSNAALQRSGIALSAGLFSYKVYPTFYGSAYCAVPEDGLVVARAETVPKKKETERVDAWAKTLNEAALNHPETRFVYDCVARHDQTEFNPTYPLVSADRVNGDWIDEHLFRKLDPAITCFVDSVQSYDEIKNDWIATEEHWTLKRALVSYNKIAEVLGLERYSFDNPRVVARDWYGDYARMGLDLDYLVDLEDDPRDFSDLTFYELGKSGSKPMELGTREKVLAGKLELEPRQYHVYGKYYGANSMEALNAAKHDGSTALVVCDSLSYPLKRYLASNYEHTVFLLPGNNELERSLEDYIGEYAPDDVIIMLHATKYRTIAATSPAFMGL